MKKILFAGLAVMYWSCAEAQFKNDNTVFKTIYIDDLCHALRQLGDGLLLDVRTPGEFSDTSMYAGLNIGRLKAARNISSMEIKRRLDEIKGYKNKPVLLLCSHSQRSRVVSKILVDSGFTNVTNINGGMTELNLHRNDQTPCLNEWYETGNKFKFISPSQTIPFIQNTKDLYIVDVRSDSAFLGKTGSAILNAYGKFVHSENLPLSTLKENINKIPKNKKLLIVDNYGDDAYQAAQMLLDGGYTDIHILFNGLDSWISEDESTLQKSKGIWQNGPAYGLMSSLDFHRAMKQGSKSVILDLRPAKDFSNQNTEQPFRNKGHIKGAINIPETELMARLSELTDFKNKEIIVYTFSGNPEAFAAAQLLINQGFKKVKVLTGGLFDLRWRAANISGMKEMMNWVVEVPVENY